MMELHGCRRRGADRACEGWDPTDATKWSRDVWAILQICLPLRLVELDLFLRQIRQRVLFSSTVTIEFSNLSHASRDLRVRFKRFLGGNGFQLVHVVKQKNLLIRHPKVSHSLLLPPATPTAKRAARPTILELWRMSAKPVAREKMFNTPRQ